MSDWVVVLEYGTLDDRRLEIGTIEDLVERLREWHPIALYHSDRYALQLHISAVAADEALRLATAYHEQAARIVGSFASFTRAEVLTLGELEQSWSSGETTPSETPSLNADRPSRSAEALTSTEVYNATRALLGASTPTEVTEILVHFVLAVGGSVHVGERRPIPAMASVEMSISPGQQLYAVADNVSVAGLILERWLPALMVDAKRRLQRP